MLLSHQNDAGREGEPNRLLSSPQGCPRPHGEPLLGVCQEEVCEGKTFPLRRLGQTWWETRVCVLSERFGMAWFLLLAFELQEIRCWN